MSRIEASIVKRPEITNLIPISPDFIAAIMKVVTFAAVLGAGSVFAFGASLPFVGDALEESVGE